MSQTLIPITKILIPKLRPDMVERPQLIDRINQGLLHDCVLISAPAGSGKTTLLSQWALQSPYSVVWLTLDERDNEPELLYQSLLLALKTAVPDFSPVEQTLPQHQEAMESFRSGLISLINAVGALQKDLVLVLDDFHVLTNPLIHNAFDSLLESIPEKVHLIISSRVDPQISLIRLRAHDQIDEIRNNQLKFNEDESREFLRKTIKIQLSPQTEEQVIRHTEGWVAGMQLAVISLQNHQELTDISSCLTGDNPYIQEFLIHEVLSRQPEHIQDFLLRTSFLQTLTGPLCDAVLDNQGEKLDSAAILRELYHKNIFLTAIDPNERWFRYHPLFADSLQRLLREKKPEEFRKLQARASEWYESVGMINEATDHALQTKDYPRAAAIIEKNLGNVFKNGGIQLILTWLKQIPEEIIKKNTTLCVAYAWGSLFTFSVNECEYWTEAAETSIVGSTGIPLNELQSKDLSGVPELKNHLGEIFAVRSILAASKMNSDEALEYSRRALRYLDPDDLFYRSYLAMEQSIYDLLDGNMIAAESSLEETIRLSQACGNWMVNMVARCHLGETQASRGKLSKALTTFKQSIPLTIDQEGKSMGFVGHLYVEMGDVLLERNELTQAETYITKGIELSRIWLPMLIELDAHLHLIHLYTSMQDFSSAKRELDIARSLTDATSSTFDDVIIDIYEARFRLQQGDLRFALDWATNQNLLGDTMNQALAAYPFSISSSMITVVSHIWLALSRQEKNPEYAQKAYDLVKQLETPLQQRDNFEMLLEVYLIEALALQELDQTDEALQLLSKAYAMGEPEGYRRIYLDEGLPLARLTNRLVAYQKKHQNAYHLPTHEYLMEMIHLFTGSNFITGASSEEPIKEDHNFAPPVEMLSPRECEVLQLAADGKTNGEIAAELCLSLNTVKRHMSSIFFKLGVISRVQAISVGKKLKIIK